jgi:D-alanyl-D-alanine dipeptidase
MVIGLLLFSFLTGKLFGAPDSSPIPPACRQLLLVVTPSYEATQGTLHTFQRDSASSSWEKVAGPTPVVVGRAGLGWGEGLHAGIPADCPVKREGDGRSPAGVFNLSTAFGFPAVEELTPLHFPYEQITTDLECVDDSTSRHYNSLQNAQESGIRDWHSSEKMFTIKNDYRLGVFVDHNATPRRPGFGSCIFLHVWSGPSIPTIGCTALAAGEMEKTIHWLNVEAGPILVQLPQQEYLRLREAWRLPVTTRTGRLLKLERVVRENFQQ